jgi:hypothetical protein
VVGALNHACTSFGVAFEPTARADAAPVGDGSPNDGSRDDESGVDHFCATVSPTPLLCADFDEGSLIAGWDTVRPFDGGVLVLDDKLAASPPGSARATLPALALSPPACAYEYLGGDYTLHYGHLTFSFDVRLGDVDGGNSTLSTIGELTVTSAPLADAFLMILSPTDSQLFDQITVDGGQRVENIYHFPLLAPAIWHHLELAVDLPPATFTFRWNGQLVASGPLRQTLSAPGTSIGVRLGFRCADVGPNEVRFDNVTLDAR